MKCLHTSLALLVCIGLGGCAEFPHVDSAWGHAYANMLHVQTLRPQDIAHPPAHAPAVADGQRLENVLKAHRKAVPAGVSKSVSTGQFQTGGSSGLSGGS